MPPYYLGFQSLADTIPDYLLLQTESSLYLTFRTSYNTLRTHPP